MYEITHIRKSRVLEDGKYKVVYYRDVLRDGETVFRIIETDVNNLEVKVKNGV